MSAFKPLSAASAGLSNLFYSEINIRESLDKPALPALRQLQRIWKASGPVNHAAGERRRRVPQHLPENEKRESKRELKFTAAPGWGVHFGEVESWANHASH